MDESPAKKMGKQALNNTTIKLNDDRTTLKRSYNTYDDRHELIYLKSKLNITHPIQKPQPSHWRWVNLEPRWNVIELGGRVTLSVQQSVRTRNRL